MHPKWYIWLKHQAIMRSFMPDPKSIELPAVTITAVLKFILMDWLGMRAFYIGGVCLFWISYFIYRYALDHSVLNYWGFKRAYFKKTLLALLPYLLASICITVVYGKLNDIFLLNPNILPVLILYPLWGIVQQFMVIGVLAESLQNLKAVSANKYIVILLTSSIFSLVHYPGILLMAFTFAMEVIFLTVYFKWRNLWAIGLAHGWIATFLIYYVLDRDLWTELFAWF
jgi:uncharacterized protein